MNTACGSAGFCLEMLPSLCCSQPAGPCKLLLAFINCKLKLLVFWSKRLGWIQVAAQPRGLLTFLKPQKFRLKGAKGCGWTDRFVQGGQGFLQRGIRVAMIAEEMEVFHALEAIEPSKQVSLVGGCISGIFSTAAQRIPLIS